MKSLDQSQSKMGFLSLVDKKGSKKSIVVCGSKHISLYEL